jgi:hypothetical protein
MSQTLWTDLKDGVQVIRLWETLDGPKKPEIAIIRIPNELYEKFHDDPEGFHKDYDIFKGLVQKLTILHIHGGETKRLRESGKSFIAASGHLPGCGTGCISAREGP